MIYCGMDFVDGFEGLRVGYQRLGLGSGGGCMHW